MVKLITKGKPVKEAPAEGGEVGGADAPPTLRHHDLQRDGLRLAAYLLGAEHSTLLRQQQKIEKLAGKKIDIRKDGKQAILNRVEAKRALIEARLREHPEWSDRRIANKLGCSHPTVTTVRSELEASGKIYQSPQLLGEDGRWYKTERNERVRFCAVGRLKRPRRDGWTG